MSSKAWPPPNRDLLQSGSRPSLMCCLEGCRKCSTSRVSCTTQQGSCTMWLQGAQHSSHCISRQNCKRVTNHTWLTWQEPVALRAYIVMYIMMFAQTEWNGIWRVFCGAGRRKWCLRGLASQDTGIPCALWPQYIPYMYSQRAEQTAPVLPGTCKLSEDMQYYMTFVM